MVTTIIKWSATWCGPCKAFKPIFERVAKMEKYSNINFIEYDIENDDFDDSLIERYGIRSVPTILLLDENGELLKKLVGSMSETSFTEIIDGELAV